MQKAVISSLSAAAIASASDLRDSKPSLKQTENFMHQWQMIECFWESSKCQLNKANRSMATDEQQFVYSDDEKVASYIMEASCYW